MKPHSLFLIIIFMLTNKTYGKENDFKEMRTNKTVEPRYHFNHPPLDEYYNPIPVAIVYEDSNSYTGKSAIASEEAEESFKGVSTEKKSGLDFNVNHPPVVESYKPNIVTAVTEDNKNKSVKIDISTVTEADKSEKNVSVNATSVENNNEPTKYEINTNNTTKISVQNKTNLRIVAKPKSLNNLQIPVAVVYDSDYINYPNDQKRKTDANSRLATLRSNFSRKIETAVNSQKEQNDHLLKEKTEALPPKVDTRVFKKRTEGRDPVVPILEMENYVFSHNGNFRYSFEGGDGTKAFSEGKQIIIDDEAGEAIVGGFSYKDKEGNDYSVTYTADENGYRPVGAHLPTPPPIPPAIARALQYLATATPDPENFTQRSGKKV